MPLASEPVRDIASMYHRKDGQVLIEIKLTTVIQLFNSFDPAPFYEKEIDTEAEHYIVDTVRDFPAKTKFKIHIYLPPALVLSEEAQKIIPAIHNHFQYKMLVADRKFRARFRFRPDHARDRALVPGSRPCLPAVRSNHGQPFPGRAPV